MIDVALTGLYDVCLFNSAAQVLFFVRSGHGNPSDSLCALTSGWFEFFRGIWLFWALSAKVFEKRQLKVYNGHLIRLLCVLCLSDYGNEAHRQFIKVHQTIGDVILWDGVCAPRCRWNFIFSLSLYLHIFLTWCVLDSWNVVCCEKMYTCVTLFMYHVSI